MPNRRIGGVETQEEENKVTENEVKETEEDGVGYDQVDEATVTIFEQDPRWRKVCIDGTVVEIPTGGWMSIRRGETSPFKVLVNESVLPA